MGFIPKRLIKENLDSVDVLVNDLQNEFFNVIDLPTTLTQGRASFKIFGSDFLKTGVPLKFELLDAAGNTVFLTPVDLVGEELPPFLPYRFVTIEVYRPPVNVEGLARLTVLGEIDPLKVDFDVPSRFQNTYNVKFNTTLNIDLSTNINNQPIRFFRNPTITAEEKVKARIVETPLTTIVEVLPSASAELRSDIKENTILVQTGSAEKPDGIPQAPKNRVTAPVEFFKEDFKFKTQREVKFPPILRRRGLQNFFASREPAPITINIPSGNLKSSMQGAEITIPEHTQKVTRLDEQGNAVEKEVTVPTFTTKINEILDGTSFVPDDIPFIPDPFDATPTSSVDTGAITIPPADGGGIPAIVPDLKGVPISMSHQVFEETVISSSIHFDSFVDLKIKNMRTFSGDVYRLKVHGAMQSRNEGFSVMADTIIESEELITDKQSQSGFLRTGYFFTQSLVDTYWTGSSYSGSTADFQGVNVAIQHTSSAIIDSIRISGSNSGVNETLVVEQKPGYEFTVDRSVPLTLTAKVAGTRTKKQKANGEYNEEGKLYFHLTGSNLNTSKQLPTNANVGGELTDVESNKVVVLKLDEDRFGLQKLGFIEFTFLPRLNLDRLNNTDTRLQIRADSGRWHISDLSLRPAADSGFSPDEFSITVPIPRTTRPDKLDTFVEFFDINNNVVETIAAKKDIEISGSAFVLDGQDNVLTGSLFMGNTAGSGIEMAGANSAFMRSVGYRGFQSASLAGEGGFIIFSGSVLPEAPDDYEGAGLEIHDGNTGDDQSFFRFRTKPSIFEVKTKNFFLGQQKTPANFISGSNGNLQISSSGFEVTADGKVTASNFRFVSGVVTEGVTIQGSVSANSLLLPADIGGVGGTTEQNASASISQQGLAKFRSGSIGGFSIGTGSITAVNFELNPNERFINLGTGNDVFKVDADVGVQLGHATFASAPFSVTKAGVLKATSGTIGGWTLSANDITSNGLLINSSGRIESANYASNQFGFRIDAINNGEAEFENVRIRGTLKTTVFEKETVNAVGGQLYVANSTTITGSTFFPPGTFVPSMSATATTMSIANSSGFVANEIVALKKVTSTGFSTEYMLVNSASRVEPTSDVDLRGHLYVVRAYNEGIAGDSGSLGDLSSTATNYPEGQVVVSTGRNGTGFIRLNANPGDVTTPYMDIVERTGSGVYDVDLKARLGDLSGLSKTRLQGTDPSAAGFGLYSQNVFLEGGIIANTGSIGGVGMKDNQLFILGSDTTPTHASANTRFYVSGKDDATAGDFSLGDKLVWDASAGTLAIVGSIEITGGDAAAQIAGIGAGAAASASAAQDGAEQTAAAIGGGAATSASNAQNSANAAQSTATELGEASASLLQGSASLATRARISSTGLEILDSSSNVIGSYGSTMRVGFDAADKTALRIAADGSLTIGTSGQSQISLASNGNATFSGTLDAAGGSFTGVIDVGAVGLGATTASLQANTTSLQNQTTGLGTATGSLQTASASLATRARITGTGIDLVQSDGTVRASYSAITTIGNTSAEHVHISADGLQIKDGATTRLSASSAGLDIADGNFVADANGNVSLAGRLYVGGTVLPPTRENVPIDNTTQDFTRPNIWSTFGQRGSLSLVTGRNGLKNVVRFTSNTTGASNQTRWFYHFDNSSMNTDYRYRFSFDMHGSNSNEDFIIRYGMNDLNAGNHQSVSVTGNQIAATASVVLETLPEKNLAGNSLGNPYHLMFLSDNAGSISSGDFYEISNFKVVATDTTGSRSSVAAVIGGFKFDDSSMYSGTKKGNPTSASPFTADGGSTTFSGDGYIAAPSFSIAQSGDAFFKGKLLDEALVEADPAGANPFQRFSGTNTSFVKDIGTAASDSTCVLSGTKIITKRGEINIEDTREDDLIKVYDWKKQEWDYSPIDKILNRVTKEGWSHIKTEKGYELKCSNSHLLYHPNYPNHAIKTDELGIGGQLYVVENGEIIEDLIKNIIVYDEPVEVWNYELEYTHNYISNGILSHNALPKLFFTGFHNYFVSMSVNIQSGDAVKLDDNYCLQVTSEKQDQSCIGIAVDYSDTLLDTSNITNKSLFKFSPISQSIHLDSFGRSINEFSNHKLLRVASLGDTRNFDTSLNESTDMVETGSVSLTGFKICNQGGLVSPGDLLCTSDTAGYLMKQPSEYVITSFSGSNPVYEERQNMNSFTVGKVMESCSFDSNGKVEGVYGYLYCG